MTGYTQAEFFGSNGAAEVAGLRPDGIVNIEVGRTAHLS